MSATRKIYFARLAGRCLVLVLCLLLWAYRRDAFTVLDGLNFFKTLSPLHLLWIIWVGDMFLQIVPVRNKVPIGSQKLFANHFRPIRERKKSITELCAAISYPPPRPPTRYSPLVCADRRHWGPVQPRGDRSDRPVHDLRAVLRLRPDLRADLVPLPADHEKSLLHHLPNL